MPARTYSTDVYLTCPCPDCEGRKVRITLPSSGDSSGCDGLTSVAPADANKGSMHQLVIADATTTGEDRQLTSDSQAR